MFFDCSVPAFFHELTRCSWKHVVCWFVFRSFVFFFRFLVFVVVCLTKNDHSYVRSTFINVGVLIKLMKGKSLRKHSLHGKTAASVLF